MSIVSPLQPIALKYREFNNTFEQSERQTSKTEVQSSLNKLLALRKEILELNVPPKIEPTTDKLFSDKIITREDLFNDMNKKVAAVVQKKYTIVDTPSNLPTPLQKAASKYHEFCTLFQKTETANRTELDSIWEKCSSLRNEIRGFGIPSTLQSSQDKEKLFPDKIVTRDFLFDDINSKMASIISKQLNSIGTGSGLGIGSPFSFSPFPFSSFSFPSISVPSFPVLDENVGYRNIANNCCIGSVMLCCRFVKHLNIAMKTVATNYIQGFSPDAIHMDIALKTFQSQSLSHEDIAMAVASYNSIEAPIFKLKTVHSLMELHVPPEILSQFIVPEDYLKIILQFIQSESIKKSTKPNSEETAALFMQAADRILNHPDTGLAKRIALLKECGNAMMEALNAFDTYANLRQTIPWQIAQKVRVAFHHLYGRQVFTNDGRVEEILSENMHRSEDPLDAIRPLMRDYEFMLKSRNEFPPSCYFAQNTTRCYELDPTITPSKHPSTTELTLGKYSSKVVYEHHIPLTLSRRDGASLEDLLFDNCSFPDNGEWTGISNGIVKTYRCKAVQTFLLEAPEHLSIVLNRFSGDALHSEKIYTKVRCNRVIATPPEMTSSGIPQAYALLGLGVHRGGFRNGHYVTYWLINGRWMEFNDERLRYIEENEMDDILHQKGNESYTPYFLYYTRVEQSQQQKMLLEAAKLRGKPRIGDDGILQKFSHQQPLLESLGNLQRILANDVPDAAQLKEAIALLGKAHPECLQKIYHLVAMDHGLPNIETAQKLCDGDALILKNLTRAWICGPGKNCIEQLIELEKNTFKNMENATTWRRMNHFIKVLYSPIQGKELDFIKLYNELPPDFKNLIETHLLKDPAEREAFEISFKAESTQAFLLKIISQHPERDLQLLVNQIDEEADSLYKLQVRHSLRNYLALLQNKDLERPQLLEAFQFLRIDSEVRRELFFKACQVAKKPLSYVEGEALFKANPRILAQPAILSKESTAEGDDATIIGQVANSMKK